MTEYRDHAAHSRLVRSFPLQRHMEPREALHWTEGATHVLRSPHSGYLVQVSFATYPAHPEHVRVRSTNWRTEHEPSGLCLKDDARAFYKALLAAGFEKVDESGPLEYRGTGPDRLPRAESI